MVPSLPKYGLGSKIFTLQEQVANLKILPHCSCNFQVHRPSQENRQPRDTVLKSNFPITLPIYTKTVYTLSCLVVLLCTDQKKQHFDFVITSVWWC